MDAAMDCSMAPAPLAAPASAAGQAEKQRFAGAFGKVAPAMFLGALDQTIVATALPAMGMELGGVADIAWVVTAYLLAATVAAPIYGRLGDAFGRKRALLLALGVFIVGSAACAAAPGFLALVAARALQGLGGGGLMTLAQALIGEAVSPRERGRFQGWFGALFALASTSGPVLGGYLAEHFGWRSVFLVNLPLGVLAAVVALRIASSPGTGRMKPDFVGIALFVTATLAFLLALSEGGQRWAWASWPVLGLFALALVSGALLVVAEQRAIDPLIPPDVVSEPVVWRSMLIVLFFAAALFGVVINLPLYLQTVLGVSPGESGLFLIPLTLAQVAVSTWTGLRISKTGKPKPYLVGGLVVASIGAFLLAAAVGDGRWPALAATLIVGGGLGTAMPAAQTAVQWSAGTARLGAATATLSFSRSVGGVVGSAAAAAVLSAVLLWSGHPDALAHALAPGGSAGEGLDVAFTWVFAVPGLLAGLAALLAFGAPAVDLGSSPTDLSQVRGTSSSKA